MPSVDAGGQKSEPYRHRPHEGIRIGIACSGGGVRSAAFNLGALQALQDRGLMSRASYLAAVSGGNYAASAMLISAALSDPLGPDEPQLWSHGSPEEAYLRQHTDYLAPGLTGKVWLGLNMVFGFLLNFLAFLLSTFIAGRVLGWGIRAANRFADEHGAPAGLAALVAMLSGVLVVVSLIGVWWARVADGRRLRAFDRGAVALQRTAVGLIGAAGLLTAAGVVVPLLAAAYRHASLWLLDIVLGQDHNAFERAGWRFGAALLWLMVAILLSSTALALARLGVARRLLMTFSALGGSGLLLVPFASSVDYSEAQGLGGKGALQLSAAVCVLLVMAFFVHNRRYSLHLFYRERLSTAFALRRSRHPAGGAASTAVPYEQPLFLSELGEKAARLPAEQRLPELVVCAAVNISGHDVPVGRYGGSFTFQAGECGGPSVGYTPTRNVERQDDEALVGAAPGVAGSVPLRRGLRGTSLTLPSMMAISGAALAPMMGRFTLPSLRFLMAITNVRLGVWIPNPFCTADEAATDIARFQRLPGPLSVWATRLWEGWTEPGALYVLREALGRTSRSKRFIYVTDGGHWENLGLVELVRRRCSHLLCFDASSDRRGDGLELGRAIALARSELGAEVELDPSATLAAAADGSSPTMVAVGQVVYPDQSPARVVYAKAALTSTASWDLKAFRRRETKFPHHSTSQQIFPDETFEAYRTLGYAAGGQAFDALNMPTVLLEQAGAEGTTAGAAADTPDDGERRSAPVQRDDVVIDLLEADSDGGKPDRVTWGGSTRRSSPL